MGSRQGRASTGNRGAVKDPRGPEKIGKLQFHFLSMVRFRCQCSPGTFGDETHDCRRRAAAGGIRAREKLSLLSQLRLRGVLLGLYVERNTLAEQVAEVLKTILGARAVSGALTQDFKKTGRLSVFLRRDQKPQAVEELLAEESWMDPANVEFQLVDGFAGEKYLVEIEATTLSD